LRDVWFLVAKLSGIKMTVLLVTALVSQDEGALNYVLMYCNPQEISEVLFSSTTASLQCYQILLNTNFDVTALDCKKNTLMHNFAEIGDISLIKILEKSGFSNFSARNNLYNTPLAFASSPEIYHYLLPKCYPEGFSHTCTLCGFICADCRQAEQHISFRHQNSNTGYVLFSFHDDVWLAVCGFLKLRDVVMLFRICTYLQRLDNNSFWRLRFYQLTHNDSPVCKVCKQFLNKDKIRKNSCLFHSGSSTDGEYWSCCKQKNGIQGLCDERSRGRKIWRAAARKCEKLVQGGYFAGDCGVQSGK